MLLKNDNFAKKNLKNTTKAHFALLGTNIFFAINFTAVKYLFNGHFIKPFGLNLIRILITTLLLWGIFFLKKQKTAIEKKDLGRLIVCSLTGIVINQLMFIKGLSLTYSIHASLLMLTTPILIMLFASFILKETITFNKTIGLLLGVTGAVVLISNRQNSGSGVDVFWGDLLVILNAVSYSFYFIMIKPLMNKYEPIIVVRILFTIGLLVALPFCWGEFAETPWHLFSIREWGILSLVIIGGTFFAYLFNIYGIKQLGASIAGSYIYSQPFFATIIAMIFLGESLEVYKIIAAALIFSGVYLSNKIS